MHWYLVEGVNPEPWAASEASIGRKGGKFFPHFHKPEQLRLYQESIKSEFVEQNPHAVEMTGDIEITFYFWRQLPSFEIHEEGAKRRSNRADATNLQKALEDALQGILYQNDRDIVSVRSVIVEQEKETSPGILIAITEGGQEEEARSANRIRSDLSQPRGVRADNIRDFDVDSVF